MAIAVHKFGNHVPVIPVLDAAPTDADFVGTPPNGSICLSDDGAGGVKLHIRASDVWEAVTVDV